MTVLPPSFQPPHDFVKLIEAIERCEIGVMVVRDVDRLTRNQSDRSRLEKAAVEHRVLLSAYAGGNLWTCPRGRARITGMETLRAKRSAVKSVRSRASSASASRMVPFGDATLRARPVRPSRRPCTRVTCRRARGAGRDDPRDDHSG